MRLIIAVNYSAKISNISQLRETEHLKKAAARGKEGVSEFLRRINVWHELAGLSVGERRFVVKDHGITDPEKVEELLHHEKFGELMNGIMLEKIISEQLSLHYHQINNIQLW